MPRLADDIDVQSQKYSTPLSSEDGRKYNLTWNEQGAIVSSMITIKTERWPFKLKDETDEEFEKRMNDLKNESR